MLFDVTRKMFGDSTWGRAVGTALELCILEEMERTGSADRDALNWLDDDENEDEDDF